MGAIEFNDSAYKTAAAPNVKAYYRMENDVTDSSGNGYNLTASGSPAYATGVFGQGIDLERGSSQYADINQAALNITGSQTFGAWVKMESINDMFIMGLAQSGVGQRALYINVTTGKPTFLIDGLTTNSFVTWDSNLSTGVWYFVVGTYDSVAQKLTLYVNGQAKTVTASGTGTALTSNFVIGRRHSFNDFYFDGIIDDAFVLDTALSADQVKELYEGRSVGELWPNYSANLQGLWHLSGTTDSSSNGYNLTNVNGATFVPAKFNNGSKHVQASDHRLTATATNANVSTSQTWLAWANYDSTGGDVFFMGFRTSGGSDYKGLSINAVNGAVYFWGGTSLTPNSINTASSVVVPNMWNCIIGVYDSVAATIKLFVDGKLLAQASTTGSFQTATSAFAIGGWGNHNAGTNMKGLLDECAIWSRAWSDTEVKNYFAWAKGMRTSSA